MGRHDWSVHAAVVEEEIFFKSKSAFEGYLFNMDLKKEPYKVVSEREGEFGGYFVVMRKRYGEYPFLGEPDAPSTDPVWIEAYQRRKEQREKER